MTPFQIDAVKTSFSRLEPVLDSAGILFYTRLFEMDPKLRKLFKGDVDEQGRKLMAMIAVAVNSLDRLDMIVPAVEGLGVRHREYGVKEEDYDTVGQALLWTLHKGLGESFTDDVREAWIVAYTVLATTMKQAARQSTVLQEP